ncbi:hypothetical protein G4B88_027316 [Cannabis sativa]|uniref:Uncharacterized protein n=1 Tax=Cannabis sativa TaxID=3483 RepID=A0A7J6HQM6_CANSA|nr:hypothetical protein G4B88_027316 [Cannabis sativa]
MNHLRAEGPASVLAIGTANPENILIQDEFPDYYFRVTKSDKSMIRKRNCFLNEEHLKQNPRLAEHEMQTLDARQDMLVVEVPKLGKDACAKAIKEWGQPKSKITHLIFTSASTTDMPGADYHCAKLLGLSPSVKRVMMYQLGCYGGGTVLRIAKDIAENNKGARVLAVCCDIMACLFRGPSDSDLELLVGQAIFGDGAAAVIVGAEPDESVGERPIFELVSTGQTILPNSEGTIGGHIREAGLIFDLHKDVPMLISNNIEKCLIEAFTPIGISDWNSIFWITHPGGKAILDKVEEKLHLKSDKFVDSRHVLSEHGNMSSSTVLFVMDELRKRSLEEGKSTTGDGFEWGVLFGFGPGLTVERVVVRSVPIKY